MTTSQIITRVQQLVQYDLDIYTGVNSTDDQICQAINESLQDLGALCFLRESMIPITLTEGQLIYTVGDYSCCTREFVRITQVTINGYQLMNARGMEGGAWSQQELERMYPTWRTDAEGLPVLFVWFGNSQVIIYPPPTASVVSEPNHFLSGQVLPLPLSAETPDGVPLLPTRVHASLASYAACSLAEPLATEAQQFQRIDRMKAKAIAVATREGKLNQNASSGGGTTRGYGDRDHLFL